MIKSNCLERRVRGWSVVDVNRTNNWEVLEDILFKTWDRVGKEQDTDEGRATPETKNWSPIFKNHYLLECLIFDNF